MLAGRFRVVDLLGEGAMAVVYRGTQDQPPFEVALKVLHPHLVGDATFVARFHREAAAAARIVHPSSVQVVDHGADGNLLFIAMELLHGKDLFEILVAEKRLSERRAVRIVVDALDALAAAHAVGVVHRDLKPENIMLVEDSTSDSGERVKVLDFGIAKILDKGPEEAGSAALTTVGTLVGTPAYMSPEQCCGEPVDARSDLYSAGVVLYQLVTGSLPFVAESPIDFAVHHLNTPPTPPSSIVPKIDPRLQAIVLGALSKHAGQRPQSAAALRDHLLSLLPFLSPSPLALRTVGGKDSLPAPFSLDPETQRFLSSRAPTLDAVDPSSALPRPLRSASARAVAALSTNAAQDDPRPDSLSPRVISASAFREIGAAGRAQPGGTRRRWTAVVVAALLIVTALVLTLVAMSR
jgi:serine/threonine-protein kinase